MEGLCIGCLAGWHYLATGTLSWQAVLFFTLLICGSRWAGWLLLRGLPPALPYQGSFALQLVSGFCVSSLWLMVTAFALPFPLTVDVGLGLLLCGLLWWKGPRGAVAASSHRPARGVEWLAVGLALLAATGWSQDVLRPFHDQASQVLIKPWSDSAYHAGLVRVLAQATGPATLQEHRLAGEPFNFFYHHAAYLWPAVLSRLTGLSGFMAVCSFLAPFGVFLSGLAAFCLGRQVFGRWGGLAAAALLLCLPDAAGSGLRDTFLSYHWLQQVAPGGYYGVAILALAWLFVFAGCRQRRPGWVLTGFVCAGVGLFFKAQIFFINAPLLWLYPALAYRGLPWPQRRLLIAGCAVVLLAALGLTRCLPFLPELRLVDGATFPAYVRFVAQQADHLPWRAFLEQQLAGAPWRQIPAAVFVILGGTFGFLLPLLLILLPWHRRPAWYRRVAVFPLVITLLYLTMALGLAYNHRGHGTPDELLHRPLVWAYFVMCLWTGGLLGALWRTRIAKSSGWQRGGGVVLLLAALAVPFTLGRGIQHGPAWGAAFTCQSVPRAVFDMAGGIQRHAARSDVVQDSDADVFWFAVLCDRQPYAGGPFFYPHGVFAARKRELEELNRRLDGPAAVQFFAARRIAWYLLRPGAQPPWAAALADQIVMERDGFRLYHFAASKGAGYGHDTHHSR